MSNKVFFTPTKFIDVRSGEESYGYRASDEYVTTCCNLWESVPDNDTDFLYLMIEEAKNNPDLDDMFQYLSEFELGCYVGNVEYSYEEIRVFLDRWSRYHAGWSN